MIRVKVQSKTTKYQFNLDTDDELYTSWSELMTDDVKNTTSEQDDDGNSLVTYSPDPQDCSVYWCGQTVALKSDDINSIMIIPDYQG